MWIVYLSRLELQFSHSFVGHNCALLAILFDILTSSGLYKPTLMWLGSAVFLVGGQTKKDTVGNDSELFESNTEFYVLKPSGAFEPFRDLLERNHSHSSTTSNDITESLAELQRGIVLRILD